MVLHREGPGNTSYKIRTYCPRLLTGFLLCHPIQFSGSFINKQDLQGDEKSDTATTAKSDRWGTVRVIAPDKSQGQLHHPSRIIHHWPRSLKALIIPHIPSPLCRKAPLVPNDLQTRPPCLQSLPRIANCNAPNFHETIHNQLAQNDRPHPRFVRRVSDPSIGAGCIAFA